mgnify:CR=1 FL=1
MSIIIYYFEINYTIDIVIYKYINMEKSRYTITEIKVMKPIKSLLNLKEEDCVNTISKNVKAKGIIQIEKKKVYLVDDEYKLKLIGIPNFLISYMIERQLIITGILIVNNKRKNIMIFEDFHDPNNNFLF